MKLIIGTFIVCAIVVYVYMDYDNLKSRFFPEEEEEVVIIQETTNFTEPVNNEVVITKEPETKFKVDEILSINAMVGDQMIWKQNMVPAWVTYDGSPNDENQTIKNEFPHREEVRVIKVAIGEGNKTWYYVRTSKSFPIAGWVEEKYLSKELPPRRNGQQSDWGA